MEYCWLKNKRLSIRPLRESKVEIWQKDLIHSFIFSKLSSEFSIVEKLKFVWKRARCLLPDA